MDQVSTLHPMLTRLRRELEMLYGDRLDRVVLFGSRARGDYDPDSDWDVAVFIHGMESLWDETGKLAQITTPYLLDFEELVVTLPFPATDYTENTPLMRSIRAEGIQL